MSGDLGELIMCCPYLEPDEDDHEDRDRSHCVRRHEDHPVREQTNWRRSINVPVKREVKE